MDQTFNQGQWGGLMAFGASIIKECNRLSILADLAYASADTVRTALRVTNRPVLMSHPGLDAQLGKTQIWSA